MNPSHLFISRPVATTLLTIGIAAAALVALFLWKKIPEPVIVAAGALIGFLAYPLLQPAWVLR